MKIITLIFLLIFPLLAYEVGDTLDKSISKKLSLNDKKITVITFFASWCNSCEKEIPELNAFNTKLKSQNFELIGVDIDKDIDNAKAFQKSLHVNFEVINDTKQEIVSAFKPLGMPSIYIIKNSKVLHVMVGARDNVESELSLYLKGLHE